jgi:hypothetical protein
LKIRQRPCKTGSTSPAITGAKTEDWFSSSWDARKLQRVEKRPLLPVDVNAGSRQTVKVSNPWWGSGSRRVSARRRRGRPSTGSDLEGSAGRPNQNLPRNRERASGRAWLRCAPQAGRQAVRQPVGVDRRGRQGLIRAACTHSHRPWRHAHMPFDGTPMWPRHLPATTVVFRAKETGASTPPFRVVTHRFPAQAPDAFSPARPAMCST